MAKKSLPNTKQRLAIIHTPLGSDKFNLLDMTGREAICELFQFSVSLSCADVAVHVSALLGKPVCIQVNTASTEKKPRFFHGVVKAVKSGGALLNQQRHYQLSIAPWLEFGSYTSHNRIFQQKTVVDIVREVALALPEAGSIDISGLRGIYPRRELCIQFEETDLQFIERILAEAGIAWFFMHQQDKHVLVLTDSEHAYMPRLTAPIGFQPAAESGVAGIVSAWERETLAHAMQVDLLDYNECTPSQQCIKSARSASNLGLNSQLKASHFGMNAFADGSDGRHRLDSTHHQQLAKRRQDTLDSNEQRITGDSSVPHFAAGASFVLTHPVAGESGHYALLEVCHRLSDGNDQDSFYSNSFECFDAARACPLKAIPERRLFGLALTARVVELKQGDDDFSQVKVKFPWDAKYSSCWLRVAQLYAGNGWGSYFVPRLGQEVIIQFLNGDLNRPVVAGALYNTDNPAPPYSRTQSGIRTQGRHYNELVFDDKTGAERVHLQAGRDFTFLVKHDERGEIRNDQQLLVARNRTVTLQNGNEVKTVRSGSATLTAQKTIRIESATQIELVVGSSKMVIGPQSVSISTTQLSIEGNAKVSAQAGGLMEIKGGIVKIN